MLLLLLFFFLIFIAGKQLPLGHSEYLMCRNLINPTFFLPVLIDVHEFQTSLELSLFKTVGKTQFFRSMTHMLTNQSKI